jgi:hypothetical protein
MLMRHGQASNSPEKEKESDEKKSPDDNEAEGDGNAVRPNPPRTTTGGWFTAPKFGSAGSGGLELEPGPERD